MLSSNITASLFQILAVVVNPSFFLLLFFSQVHSLFQISPSWLSVLLSGQHTTYLICFFTPYWHWSPVLVSQFGQSYRVHVTVSVPLRQKFVCTEKRLFPNQPIWWKPVYSIGKLNSGRCSDAGDLGLSFFTFSVCDL